MRKYNLVRDDSSVLSMLIIIVIVVVAIVLLAVLAVAYVNRDDYGEEITDDDIAVIYVQGSLRITDVGIFSLGLPGLIDALAGGTRLSVDSRVEYDIHSGDDRDLIIFQLSPLSGWFDKDIKLKCTARCTGPGGYDDTCHDNKEISFNVFADTTKVQFEEFQFPVEKAGIYKIVVSVTADKEDISEKAITVRVGDEK